MSISPESNYELCLTNRFVEETDCNVFLTGKAGTGKTTFLKNLHKKTGKKMITTAPTGVAAINAGGVTLHSFFQLPLGPFVPGENTSDSSSRQQYKLSKAKREIIHNLDLLVIDEISMVRADLLDAVDNVLRRYRRNNLPFGNVQLLMIGDLHQLPPVVKREDWQLLGQIYNSAYFFNSKALTKVGFISVELKKIYRQSDEQFIAILNQLRENQLDSNSINTLNKRFIPEFVPDPDQEFITLTTHNDRANTINESRLDSIDHIEKLYKASVSGEFPEHSYPAPYQLYLKKGAQVMFLRNDVSPQKQYFNGKIGKVVGMSADGIEIDCPDDKKRITVEPATWENIRYSLNRDKTKIEEEIIGTFKQFPLKLAWAVTIHKSQGLTFEKVIIDAGASFVHGQTYVALSRCKTLDGIVLASPLSTKGIQIDEAIARFDRMLRENPPSNELLDQARSHYQQKLLLDCFDLGTLKKQLSSLAGIIKDNKGNIYLTGSGDIVKSLDKANQELFPVSEKFRLQLQGLFQKGNLPESDPKVQERLKKASAWFQTQFDELFKGSIEKLRFSTDNSILHQQFYDSLYSVQLQIAVKREAMKSLEQGFSPSEYLNRIYRAEINFSGPASQSEKAENTESNTLDLFYNLDSWRAKKSDAMGIAKHQIIPRKVMKRIIKQLPTDIASLNKIEGVGQKTIKNFGQEIIDLVNDYLERKNKLTSNQKSKSKDKMRKKKRKTSPKTIPGEK
ncbi:MAG: AAA family ATPase [Proteobacteria bacterium]|nr:AAA family ATPase [Pseudomonadota bacterium]